MVQAETCSRNGLDAGNEQLKAQISFRRLSKMHEDARDADGGGGGRASEEPSKNDAVGTNQ